MASILSQPQSVNNNRASAKMIEFESNWNRRGIVMRTSYQNSMLRSFNTLRPRQNGRHFPDDIFKWIFLNENIWISIKISLKFVNWTPRNKFQWNFNRNSNIFNQGNAVENVVCEMASILSQPQSVNNNRASAKMIEFESNWNRRGIVMRTSYQNSMLRSFNTLRPRQNGRHFPDDIFKWIFLNENIWISIKISLKFVSKGPINNIPALGQIMAWRRSGDKPLSEPMIVSLPTHICVTRLHWVK